MATRKPLVQIGGAVVELPAEDVVPAMGGAGGVLSGNYPNPGFAVDMATQSELDSGLAGKQATLVSGTNIKTVNGSSLLGSGNIIIEGGGGGGGIPEAPINGKLHGRKDAGWVEVPVDTSYPSSVFGPAQVHTALGGGAAVFDAWLQASSGNRDLFLELCYSTYGLAFCAAGAPSVTASFFGAETASELLISDLHSLQIITTTAAMLENWIKHSPLAKAAVPKMTSNTAPSGVASASSEYSSTYQAFRAFDQTAVQWSSSTQNSANQWISYSFPSPVFIHTCGFHPYSAVSRPTSLKAQWSDDGSVWTTFIDIPTFSEAAYPAGAMRKISGAIPGRHQHWRVFMPTSAGYCEVQEILFEGFA